MLLTNLAPGDVEHRPQGSALEVLAVATRLGLHLLRRPDRASRLLPRRVRGQAPVARRATLRRPGGALPVPARPGEQPGRASRSASCAPACSAALAAWLGFTLPSALALVLFAYGVSGLGATRRRLAARPEGRGGRRRRPGGLGDGAQPLPRSRAGHDRDRWPRIVLPGLAERRRARWSSSRWPA